MSNNLAKSGSNHSGLCSKWVLTFFNKHHQTGFCKFLEADREVRPACRQGRSNLCFPPQKIGKSNLVPFV